MSALCMASIQEGRVWAPKDSVISKTQIAGAGTLNPNGVSIKSSVGACMQSAVLV